MTIVARALIQLTLLPIIERAWYRARIDEFLRAEPLQILGALVERAPAAVEREERDAWNQEINILKGALIGLTGELLLEYSIPRVGGRADAVVVSDRAVAVVEFKIGAAVFTAAAREQVWDYALDLKNFHVGSHAVPVVPLLVATAAPAATISPFEDWDGVYRPLELVPAQLPEVLNKLSSSERPSVVRVREWATAEYRPTPTIIEAARALYARHSVQEISRSDAEAKNLAETAECLEANVRRARENGQKVICFVTGVPGAGKTLAGLNVATHHRTGATDPAVFLSGNGPLVQVLRAALVRDASGRSKAKRGTRERSETAARVKAFIQNVHHFRDEALGSKLPPPEHIAVFDEAQRAWTQEQTANFMRRRKGVERFPYSEPEFLLRYMDRHQDWAAVVCLVGGGQEINTGEAGITSWLAAVRDHLPDWRVVVSTRLTDAEYAEGELERTLSQIRHVQGDDRLHLAVSMRSFRAESVSAFVKAVLDSEEQRASELLRTLSARYPIALTRDLRQAKEWLRRKTRGSERMGIVASSKALRLKASCLDVRIDIDPVHWFLNGSDDVRSSNYLEDVATEFQVQGLEIDWACVAWDGDLRRTNSGWTHHDFRGSKWNRVNKVENQRYLLNSYRVLLTRARQGMVVFVPKGGPGDHTRRPEYYDATFEYLRGLGIETV